MRTAKPAQLVWFALAEGFHDSVVFCLRMPEITNDDCAHPRVPFGGIAESAEHATVVGKATCSKKPIVEICVGSAERCEIKRLLPN